MTVNGHAVSPAELFIPDPAEGHGPPRISIIIPTRNGGAVFGETLRAVLSLESDHCFEVIVVDTESTDGTAGRVRAYGADPQINKRRVPLLLVGITRAMFGHGCTRNRGAELAQGQIVVFLSQDATPMGADWLDRFLAPLAEPDVVAAFCRQIARPGVSLTERFILETAYPARSSRRTCTSLRKFGAGYILFSNAASAIKRAELLQHPFNETLLMCEDQDWAIGALQRGHSIAYVAEAAVAHSHHYSLRGILARNFDFAVSHSKLPVHVAATGYLKYLRAELTFVRQHGGLADLLDATAFEAVRSIGYLLGQHYEKLPSSLC
jgi:rhamnosyltransferase